MNLSVELNMPVSDEVVMSGAPWLSPFLLTAAPDLLAACEAALRGEPGWEELMRTAVARARGGR